MTREECRKYLRYLELDAYAKMVSALRAQGPLTEGKQKLLGELAHALHIPNERHKAEVRRAVNDDKLSLIAEQLFGPNSDTEWTVEGRRMIPLLSRLKGRSAYTTFANSLSLTSAIANERQTPHVRKQEGKYKNNPYYPKYDDKYLNNDGENTFAARKKKRSSHDMNNLNNGTLSYPSTSYNKKIFKPLSNTKSYLPSQTVMNQSTSRQRIDLDKSDQSHSKDSKELRLKS